MSRPRLSLLAAVFFLLTGCVQEDPPQPESDTSSDAGVDATADADGGADVTMDAGDTSRPDGDTGPSDDGATRKQCGSIPSPPPGKMCGVEQGSSDWLLLQGDVLTESTIYENGQVLVRRDGDASDIRCTGCDCAESAEAEPTVVSCADGVISPSLINPHDHLGWATAGPYDHGGTRYNHRHEWRTGARMSKAISTPDSDFSREAVLHGELRQLFAGTTSIAGSTSGTEAQGLLRNLDNAGATGGLDGTVEYSTFPLKDYDGTLRESGCDYNGESSNAMDRYDVLREEIYLPHVAEGIGKAARNEFTCMSKPGMESRDLIEDNTSIIHGIGMTAGDVRELATNGGQLVWSPRTNIALYGQTAEIMTYRTYGVPIALGTDWSVTGSMNLLRELACAARLNRAHYDRRLSDRALWKMVTKNAALALGASDQIGTLQKGNVADIAIFDGTDEEGFGAVVGADSSDVHLVMRGGRPLYGDQNVVDRLLDKSATEDCSDVNVCGATRRVCVGYDTADNEDGAVTFQQLKSAASDDAYPLFSCGEPESYEPTCMPERPDAYDGMSTMDDPDGDGIPNAEDNCPEIFNPSRPLEDQQPDADGDGAGNVCDPCPTDKSDECNPDDVDGDGVPDTSDNCPQTPNRAQADGDDDGIGDACDQSTTPYAIHNGAHTQGERVELDGLVVTAVDDGDRPGFFAQVSPDNADYEGAEGSGIYIRLGDAGLPERGDAVDVTGRVTDFHGRLQISGVTDLAVRNASLAMPEPKVVSPCTIATGGAKMEDLMGALVRVESVTVTDSNPDGPDENFGEFAVGDCGSDGGLRVDDLLYLIEPDPQNGWDFASIVGPLHYSFNNSKVVPRDAEDVEFGDADLSAITPSPAYLPAQTTATPSPGFALELDHPSSTSTAIDMSYPDDATVSGPSTVTVPAGQLSVSPKLEGKQASQSLGDYARIEAAVGSSTPKTAEILVYDDALRREITDVSTNTKLVRTTTSFQITLRLAIPAASNGTTVELSTDSDLGLPKTQPSVPADAFTTTVSIDAGTAEGKKTITATSGGATASVTVNVKDGPVGDCLIVSEYIEGSGQNKAIELYNCGGSTLDLSNFGACIAYNDNTSCSSDAMLNSTMLPPQKVYTLCNTDSGPSGNPVDGIQQHCQQAVSNVINFNGNDRLVVFEDKSGNDEYDPTDDALMDAFGQVSNPPSGEPWKDTTYRRCNLQPYRGMTSFAVKDYYTAHPKNDASHYGTPPSRASCP